MDFGEAARYRALAGRSDETAAELAAREEDDTKQRRRLPGEQAVALLFTGLFSDAAWYLQGGGRFPDGLPPYAHSPQYLTLFSIVLRALQTKRNRDEANAMAAARAQQPRH